jgi:hypothetical protein
MVAGCYQRSTPRPTAPPPASPYAYAYPYPYPAPLPPQSPYAQLAVAESAQRNAVRAAPPPPAISSPAQINLAALAAVQRVFGKGCSPFQVAQGSFARLDCRRYGRVASARVVDGAGLLRLFGAGQMRLDPPTLGTLTPPLFLTGLQSLLQGVAPPSPAPGPSPAPVQGLPASVDHRVQGTEGPVKDQQLVGACTAFSLSTVMDNAIRRLNASDVVSPMHIWSHYADPTMPSAESGNENRALAIWADYPYDEREACRMETQDDGCAELLVPAVQVNTAASDPVIQGQIHGADARGRYTITAVDQIDPIDPNVLAVDLAMGKDIWFAMGVSQDAWTSPQVQQAGVVPDWLLEDGGHAVALAGYRATPSGRQFLVHNSWGASWGQGGYAWVSETMLRTHGQYAYTVTVADRAAPAPPPTPVPVPGPGGGAACPAGFAQAPGIAVCQKVCATSADCGAGGTCVRPSGGPGPATCVATNPLTDDDCSAGQLVDIVTGQCARGCAYGMRPAAGWCALGPAP